MVTVVRMHIFGRQCFKGINVRSRLNFARGMSLKPVSVVVIFGIIYDGRTIWIEAIVASPDGIPADYLQPPANKVQSRQFSAS